MATAKDDFDVVQNTNPLADAPLDYISLAQIPDWQRSKEITISVGTSVSAKEWPAVKLSWDMFLRRLEATGKKNRSKETMAQFLALPKAEQNRLKDVGGFVGGLLKDNIRNDEHVISRDLLAIDLDNAKANLFELVQAAFPNTTFCVYSTRKHTTKHPRYRLLMPTSRDVKPEEYQPFVRQVVSKFDPNMSQVDTASFKISQLMFFPSVCADGEFVLASSAGDWINVSDILNEIGDWHNADNWAKSETEKVGDIVKHALKAEDPWQKKNWIGACALAYTVQEMIAEHLSDTYTPVSAMGENRYTYIQGTSAGGGVIYGDGRWLYSFHDTDPAGHQLLNAFDLLRVHKFGSLDDPKREPYRDPTKRPSYKAMVEWCRNDPKVNAKYAEIRHKNNLEQRGVSVSDTDFSWMEALQTSPKTGAILSVLPNYECILVHDPKLQGLVAWDAFRELKMLTRWPKWRNRFRRLHKEWDESDLGYLLSYFVSTYGLGNMDLLKLAVNNIAGNDDNAYHEVQQYLEGLSWDGKPRIATLAQDFLGAPNNDYVRTVIRKTLVAAVKRVFEPGCPWDKVPVFFGEQGIGKTLFVARLAKNWGNTSINDFTGKNAMELLPGSWIVELGEMAGMGTHEMRYVKALISSPFDLFRGAYRADPKKHYRQCIFIATTNGRAFLIDKTGNRRWLPIDCSRERATKSLKMDGIEKYFDQVWAEAYHYYKQGESLVFPPEIWARAVFEQQMHEETRPLEGLIESFVERKMPVDWASMSIDARRAYLRTPDTSNAVKKIVRNKVCALEIYCEMLGRSLADNGMSRLAAIDIQQGLDKLLKKGWKEAEPLDFGYPYGMQKALVRKGSILDSDSPNYDPKATDSAPLPPEKAAQKKVAIEQLKQTLPVVKEEVKQDAPPAQKKRVKKSRKQKHKEVNPALQTELTLDFGAGNPVQETPPTKEEVKKEDPPKEAHAKKEDSKPPSKAYSDDTTLDDAYVQWVATRAWSYVTKLPADWRPRE